MTNDVTQPAAAPSAEFRVGAVLSRSFSVLFRNFVPFVLLGVVFTLPSQYFAFFPEILTGNNVGVVVGVTLIVHLLCMSVLTATIVYGTILQLRGGHASMLDCFVKGLGLLLPVIAVSLLTGLIVGFGAILLIIPGLILYTVLWVAVPSAVVERPGIINSLKRSAELTKGCRWQIFSVIIILSMIGSVFDRLVSGPAVAVWSSDGGAAGIVAAIVALVVQAAIAALGAVAVAVGYHDLRIAKEGVDSDRIAAVFD
jgi:uncharacterized membrane protein